MINQGTVLAPTPAIVFTLKMCYTIIKAKGERI